MALLAACSVTAWSGMRGLRNLDGELRAVVHGDMARLLHVTHVRRLFRSMALLERDHLLAATPEAKRAVSDKIEKTRAELRDRMAMYEAVALPEDAPRIADLHTAYTRFNELDDRVQAASRAGGDEAQALSAAHAKDPVQWERVIGQLIKTNEARLAREVAATERAAARARLVLLAAALAGRRDRARRGDDRLRGIRRTMDEVVKVNENLESLVEQRTRALAEREASIRLILDSTGDGLCVVELDGALGGTRSRALEAWFGAPGASSVKAWDYLFPDDARTARALRGLVRADRPPAPALRGVRGEMPARVPARRARLRLRLPAHREGRAARAGARHRLRRHERGRGRAPRARDARVSSRSSGTCCAIGSGFRVFVTDGAAHLRTIETSLETRALMHALHTLKGNAYVYGVTSLGDACHRLETAVIEDHLPDVGERAAPLGHLARRDAEG